jgi:two-component system, OmpR family, sensor histidine kinase ChvG
VNSSRLKAGFILRSFAAKILFLLLIFVTFPLLIFTQFAGADRQKNELLFQSIQREGELIARSLLPVLRQFQSDSPDVLQEALDRLRTERRNIKVLARPDISGEEPRFFYIAASPKVDRDRLDQERAELLATGLFDQLSDTCEGYRPLATRFINAAGKPEILTSLTPAKTGDVCFVVVTSHTGSSFLESSLGRPFWRTRTVQLAILIYAVMVALVVWLFADVWRNLRAFRTAAHAIRLEGPGAGSFTALNRIPELSAVAEDIDRLVEDLHRSRQFIRDAAEETAHTLKAPLAVMSQSLEPLKRAVPDNAERAQRGLANIESSIERMDALISAARDLETQVADLIGSRKLHVDLSSLTSRLVEAYRTALAERGIELRAEIVEGVRIFAIGEVLETVVENILDNAASFAPDRSAIFVSLQEKQDVALLTVADEGPGVDSARLDLIFERYVSFRDATGAAQGGAGQGQSSGFGIGLWIVRRNVEALEGRVSATNRSPHGLEVTVSLPLAP